ncbi:MAG: bifunctional 5,10-methylene-tetrahydrofolate dehydrogenase/5,10-methylene-tetrahydrofolate cyclohydrolase, partial [Pirellulales bacterium]|nr:bifunctional 5,10-methylene-tetrahydrofolate dehydrogenase/5,10-methylene-tetrahydrofolate cyclohydrolase [Pirellulales bacterium]
MAKDIRRELAHEIAEFVKGHRAPTLAAVLVGSDPASEGYVRNKRRDCKEGGIQSDLHHLPENTTQDELLALIDQLNHDRQVHGILVQLPVPEQIDTEQVLRAINPLKD